MRTVSPERVNPLLRALHENHEFKELMSTLRREHDSIQQEFGLTESNQNTFAFRAARFREAPLLLFNRYAFVQVRQPVLHEIDLLAGTLGRSGLGDVHDDHKLLPVR